MSQATHRLSAPSGRFIDRGQKISFSFEGQHYDGFAGDSIASALAAHGVRLLSRSFKYHRPRGILAMAGQDANCLVQLPEEPNVRADKRVIVEGMAVRGQNYWGSLEKDRGRWIEPFGRFMPVGFYYKAFYKPKGAWRWWEPIIRRFAGLGTVNQHAEEGYFDKTYAFADVAVIGGGPAGLSAALQAARAGGEVFLIDDNPRLGGSLNYARFDAEGGHGIELADELTSKVNAKSGITVLTDAACTGWFADNWLAVIQGHRLIKLRARSVVLATGSIEQPMIFRHNDLPGIMLGSAAQRLIRLYGVRPGRRAVVVTANADGYGVTLDLLDTGVEVAAVVDLRPKPTTSALAQAVGNRGIRVMTGHTVYEAIPGPGKQTITGAVIDAIQGQGKVAGRSEKIPCDLICMSTGYTPAGQLACHWGGRLIYDEDLAMLVIDQLPGNSAAAAGSVNATFDLDAVLAEGRHAGWEAARTAVLDAGAEPELPKAKGAEHQNYPWPIFPHPKGKDFVDFDEDLQVKDILNSVADGYDDIELVKRYSSVAMGPSQGRHSALNNLRLTHHANGNGLKGMTLTTQRPPFQPESIHNLAGRRFQPTRLTGIHHRHAEAGAQFMPAGVWLRPGYYGKPDQEEATIQAEARAVREGVGIIDVSTLGGLEIRGPDAAEFMNRMYTFAYARQPVGRARYVLMTDQTGAVMDDGVACRITDQHFYVTATTSGVDAVYRSMLRWNAEWRLQVDVANVTAAYAGVNLAGPKSRQVLEKLVQDIDLSAAAFPYMGVFEAQVADIPARLLRVGFVGELGYEIHVPASQAEALWDALMEAGQDQGIRPFGVAAQRLLRLEKGHIIVGQDTDGLTFPQEAEMGWAIAGKKPFFVGKRAIEAQAARLLTRKLIGFTLPPESPMPQECNLTVRGGEIVGRITSVARSETCGKIIGLAYVAPDQAKAGQYFDIKLSQGDLIQGEVVPVPFFDPENKRQEL